MTADDSVLNPPSMANSFRFKQAFRQFSAGISVVTAVTEDGWFGMTASSVASVSSAPVQVSFSLPTDGRTARRIISATTLGVHLLPVSKAGLADVFARRDSQRFAPGQGWELSGTTALRLQDALATLTGSPAAVVPVGPATLIVLEIAHIELGPSADPLTYQQGTYRGLGRPAMPSALEQGT